MRKIFCVRSKRGFGGRHCRGGVCRATDTTPHEVLATAVHGLRGDAQPLQGRGGPDPWRIRRLLSDRGGGSRSRPVLRWRLSGGTARRSRGAPRVDLTASTAEAVARASYGKLVAFLAARTRDVAAAEDALADAF